MSFSVSILSMHIVTNEGVRQVRLFPGHVDIMNSILTMEQWCWPITDNSPISDMGTCRHKLQTNIEYNIPYFAVSCVFCLSQHQQKRCDNSWETANMITYAETPATPSSLLQYPHHTHYAPVIHRSVQMLNHRIGCQLYIWFFFIIFRHMLC